MGSLPETIGPYRVLSELGRGMMGVVYKAQDTRSGRLAALKVIRFTMAVNDEQRKTFERRFVEEAGIVARLDHPGIVGVIEIGRDPEEDAPFIAFEYLEGQTLGAMLQGGPLPWKEGLRIVAEAARALHYAHGQGVIHRDIKPANIMVLPKKGAAKLMDFGLAKQDAGADLTSTGQFLGTPMYMSPEQATAGKLDARTDIFSLGCVAYTTLTGRRAFEAESIPQVMNKVTYQHPARPTQVVPALPAAIDYLLGRAMSKSPGDRHPTARAFAEDIEDVVKGKKPQHRAGWTEPAGTGEGTLVSARGSTAFADTGEIELEPIDDRPRRRGGAGPVAVLGLSMLLLGVFLYSSAFWKDHLMGGPDLPPATLALPAAMSDTPGPAPTEVPAPTAEPTDAAQELTPIPEAGAAVADEVPAAVPPGSIDTPPASADTTPEAAAATAAPVPTASPSPASTPSPTPRPQPRPRPRPRPRPVDPSRLSVTLEHSLKSGSLRVFVDKELVMDQRLGSRVTKDLLVFKQRSGRAQDVLAVAPGVHRLRVEVRAEQDTRVRETTATFKPGVTRALEVKLGRGKGELTLSWR